MWGDSPDDSIQRLALDQRDQCTPMTLADHDVTLPVTNTLPGYDNDQTLIDRDLVGDAAAPVIGAIALAPNLLAAQRTVQITA